jgi:DNA-binding CsgD family transcriptional regulator
VTLVLAAAIAAGTVAAYLSVDSSQRPVLLLFVLSIALVSGGLGLGAGLTAAGAALAASLLLTHSRSMGLDALRALILGVVFVTSTGLPQRLAADRRRGDLSATREAEEARDSLKLLSRREIEILALVAEGSSNAEIADLLVISRGTVKSHVHQILRKLGASNRTEATYIYLKAVARGAAGGPDDER